MDNDQPMTPGYEFAMGIVKIGGDAVKVEDNDGDQQKSDDSND